MKGLYALSALASVLVFARGKFERLRGVMGGWSGGGTALRLMASAHEVRRIFQEWGEGKTRETCAQACLENAACESFGYWSPQANLANQCALFDRPCPQDVTESARAHT